MVARPDESMSLEEFLKKNKDAEVLALKQQQEEQHAQQLAQEKEKEADNRRNKLIEDFYAQKEKS